MRTAHETVLDVLDASAHLSPSTMGGRAENGQVWRFFAGGQWLTGRVYDVKMSATVQAHTVSSKQNDGHLVGQYTSGPTWEYLVQVGAAQVIAYGTTPGRRVG